jgi:hypothetical protein
MVMVEEGDVDCLQTRRGLLASANPAMVTSHFTASMASL